MKRALFFTVGLLVALTPLQVDAQLSGTIQSQEYLDWLGGSGVASTGLSSSVQVGPYRGEFDPWGTRTVTSNQFALYCVDYLHYAETDNNLVNVYGLGGDVGSLTTTRFGDQDTYVRAAYLSSLFEDYATSSERRTAWSGLHAAIWSVTSGVNDLAVVGGEVEARMNYFLGLDVPDWFTGEDWYVLSDERLAASDYQNPNYDGSGQEFLVRRTSVPEPATILLMLTGLVMLVGVNRKRLLALQDL